MSVLQSVLHAHLPLCVGAACSAGYSSWGALAPSNCSVNTGRRNVDEVRSPLAIPFIARTSGSVGAFRGVCASPDFAVRLRGFPLLLSRSLRSICSNFVLKTIMNETMRSLVVYSIQVVSGRVMFLNYKSYITTCPILCAPLTMYSWQPAPLLRAAQKCVVVSETAAALPRLPHRELPIA